MAWVAAAVALAGFSTTYLLPMAGARFDGPVVAHIHGALFFGWIALMVVQTTLIRRGDIRLHRAIGMVALPLALAMAISGVAIGVHATRRDVAAGGGDFAISSLLGTVTAMTMFAAYVCIGITVRKRPDWHKRMMLLATIAVLWPAWFRFRHFMPWVPRPEIWLALVAADAAIPIAMLRDRLAFGRVHPAYWIFGVGLIAEQTLEVLLFDTHGWRMVAGVIYSAFG
jgi:uncharacterized membrane protein YozB (DUF420 family)